VVVNSKLQKKIMVVLFVLAKKKSILKKNFLIISAAIKNLGFLNVHPMCTILMYILTSITALMALWPALKNQSM